MAASRIAFPVLDEQTISFLFVCGNFDGAGLLYARIRPHKSNLSKAFTGVVPSPPDLAMSVSRGKFSALVLTVDQ